MSEGGGSAGPDIGPNYQNPGPPSYSNPPSQPPTPSSTVQDPPNYQSNGDLAPENPTETKANLTNLHPNSNSGLPPFSSFAASDVNEGLGGRLAGDGYLTSDGISSTRVMELSGWDYCYTDGVGGRYIDRGDSMPVMIPQPQYRPWESKQDGSSDSIKSTLPSFQSQFGEELVTTLTTLTPAACSPAPSVPSPGLPSFHTLSAVNPRYPLVPAPVQAREIPSIQQQFLDERHIHLFQGPPGQNFTLQPQNGLNGQTLTSLNSGTTLTTLNNAQYHPQIINNAQILPSGQILAPQSHILAPSSQIITSNGHIITSSGSQGLTVVSQNSTPTVLTVVKTEPVNIVELKSSSEPPNLTQLHHTNFQNPMITQGQQMDSKFGLESPPRVDGRKKERRKIRASSLESSNESDGAMSVESSGQVAAVSSTAGFKSPMTPGQMNNEDTGEKQTKKKRKRCGECIGCQRKDNCGDCAPCRNDKSHQICKMRRCEKLTEKKHLLAYNREDGGVSFRGRGRGRGRGSRGGYRGKGARPNSQTAQSSPAANEMNSTPGLIVGSNRETVKVEANRVNSNPAIPGNPALTPAMAVPFYATGTEVWSASTPADPWANQGQFIHQIDDIRYQHYPGYQTTGYQQTGFITDQSSAFQPQYTNATNGNPATSPAQGNVTPRSTGNYTQVHTPTPTPSPNPSTPHVNGHRNGMNVHYVEENYVNGTAFATDSSMAPPGSTTPNSRSSSVQMDTNESNSKTSGYMSGNEIPGYPLNSPQCQSSCNSSGYPGQSVQSEYGDQQTTMSATSYQSSNGQSQGGTQKSPSYAQASPGAYHNYQNYNQQLSNHQNEDHQNSVKSSMSPGNCHPSQKSSGIYSQNSPKNFNSNPSPQNYQEVSPGQNRNGVSAGGNAVYENRSMSNGNMFQSDRFDQQNYPAASPSSQNYGQSSPNQEKSNVNARIKSMIMNKQQTINQTQQQNVPNNNFSASSENQLMSPHHEIMSPGHQQQQQQQQQQHQQQQHNSQLMSQMMSPISNQQLLSPNHHHHHPHNQMMSPNGKDSKGYLDKIQQNDYGDKKREPLQMNENGNHHFLAFSHHLQDRSRLQPEGGGVQYWAGKFVSGTNSQYPKISNYPGLAEPYTQGRKSKKKKDTCASLHAFNKFALEDLQLESFHGSCERNNNIHNQFLSSSCVPTDLKPKNFYALPDSIRTLETTFPIKRTQMSQDIPFNHSKSTVFGSHDISEFNEHKFYQSNYNFQVQNSSNLNNNYFSKDKQKNFQGKDSCDHLISFYHQNFQSFNGVNYEKGEDYKHLNYNEPEKGIGDENYGKVNIKTGLGFENNEFSQEGHKQQKTNGDVKLDLPLIDIPFGQQSTIKQLPNSEPRDETSRDEITPEKVKKEKEEEEQEEEEEETGEDSPYPKISYAPRFKNMKIIDKRFETCDAGSKTNWTNYQKDRENQNSESEFGKKENYLFQGEGGPIDLKESTGSWCCRLGGTDTPPAEHLRIGCCQGYRTADEFSPENKSKALVNDSNEDGSAIPVSDSDGNSCDKVNPKTSESGPDFHKDFQDNVDRLRNNLRADVPDCKCFPPDKCPPEPGSYYTHLGAAASLSDLRKELESRTGQTGKALRFEKICYTGKEGKTTQGCPLAKWVIRRSGLDEKVLIVVKHRQGHTCSTAWIVVCLVAWEGVPTAEADKVYTLLSHKLNKFGLPTTRRCATNEPRTCACQGLNPDTCGASFSFGCSWSMYYNGCKYARSKTVRKFRLSVRSEEQDVEERMHVLATLLSPLYSTLAPNAFHNQTLFEREASECRLGFKPGRPFSGVTACIDFCAHSHRDLHNMNNGCTVVVTLTKHRSLSKPDDEQLHVLPLYIMDDTDEFGCKEGQEEKCKNGSIECLNKFPCEVRVRAVPLQPCRRHGKKRKEEDVEAKSKDFSAKTLSPMGVNSRASPMQTAEMQSMMELQLQSSQVSSTVLDSPVGGYKQWSYSSRPECEGLVQDERWSGNHGWTETEFQRKQNWINPSQMPSHWEYPDQFVSDSDVNPDSTTNQTGSFAFKRNAVPGVASYVKYNASVPLHNASWNPVQQMNGKGLPALRADDGKDEKFDGQSNEQTFSNSFPFRMPRGRPPSVQNFVSEQSETYLKPKDIDESAFSFSPKIKQEFDNKSFERRNAWFENDLGAMAAQTNSFTMNSSFNYCQTKNEVNSRYSTECRETPNSSWPAFVDKDHTQTYFNGPVRWNDTPWDVYGSNEFYPGSGGPEVSKSEPIGEVTDFIENEECFKDSQMGGVAIALGHGSVLFECAKHELHATTALKKPNRLRPTRISLVFYQHRNLNRAKHGWEEWEEKMRLRKLGISSTGDKVTGKEIGKHGEEPNSSDYMKLAGLEKPMGLGERILLRSPTYTTTTWTTLFPMRPCMVTGPYQAEGDTEK